jgi:hypothetical protein
MKQINNIFNRYPGLKTLYNILLFIGSIAIFIYLVEDIGIFKSTVLYLGFVLLVFIYKLYQWRAIIMYNIREFEVRQFGKPLDRNKWDHGELSKKKLKLVWKKPEVKKCRNKRLKK